MEGKRSMELGLTANAFAKLLAYLGADRERAGEKYEDLRRTLIRFFEWRGAPFPEEQADETFNRVARKLDEGVQIKNIGGYCYEVARLVCLESLKGPDSKRSPLEPDHLEVNAADTGDEAVEKELRLACLDDCLRALPAESRELITGYYQDERGSQIDYRRALAERLGVRRDALANRAQRLRDKLEQCVAGCLKNKLTI
jgi:DNA-directed RNA polymerase specialized sigma24 family protein